VSVSIDPRILNLSARWSEWSASRPGRFTPAERATGTHSTGGWMGPNAGLDVVGRRKIPSPCLESNPGIPARSLVAILS